MDPAEKWAERALSFQAQAQEIFSKHDTSVYRVSSVEGAKGKLDCLSIRQHELFDEALGAVKYELYRSAYVMAWAGFIDVFEHKVMEAGTEKLKSVITSDLKYKRIQNCSDIEEIRKKINESTIIELAVDVGLIKSDEASLIQGKLRERNRAAHPEKFRANRDTTLGYIHELFHWIEELKDRPLIKK